jgi:hypothetical protein
VQSFQLEISNSSGRPKKARAFYSRILCVVHGKHTRMLRAPVTCAAEIGFYLRSGFHVASGYYLFDSYQAIFDAG